MKSSPLIRYYLPAVVWWAFTVYLFLLPGSALPTAGWMEQLQVDKWVHIFLFAVLVWLVFRAAVQPSFTGNRVRVLWLIVLVAVVYGVSVEFMQKYWVVNRSFSVLDIVADAVGCGVASAMLHVTGRLRRS